MQNPLGLVKGDLRKRKFDWQSFSLSAIAPTKKMANERADWWWGKGVRVRVVKIAEGWGLYTR